MSITELKKTAASMINRAKDTAAYKKQILMADASTPSNGSNKLGDSIFEPIRQQGVDSSPKNPDSSTTAPIPEQKRMDEGIPASPPATTPKNAAPTIFADEAHRNF